MPGEVNINVGEQAGDNAPLDPSRESATTDAPTSGSDGTPPEGSSEGDS
jgi:hypothetical protein